MNRYCHFSSILRRPCLGLVLGLALVLAAGCRSTGSPQPKSKSTAWVVVPAVDLVILRSAIESVFIEESFEPGKADLTQMVFDKPGSRMSGLVHGSWLDGTVWVRVKVNMTPFQSNSYLLESDVYMVRHRGDTIFEEEYKSMRFKKKPFRQQLEKVKQRVEAAPPPVP